MKKWIPVILSMILLLSAVSPLVLAENENAATTTSTVATDSTSTSTSTATDSDPTSSTTKPTVPGVDYKFKLSFNQNTKILTVTWVRPNNTVSVDSIVVGGTKKKIEDNTGSFGISLSNFLPGEYNIAFIMSNDGVLSEPVTVKDTVKIPGSLDTLMTVKVDHGSIIATITDESKRPIAEYPITLYFGTEKQDVGVSDANGRVTFNVVAPGEDTLVKCVADDKTIGVVTYKGCEATLTNSPPLTQGTDVSETTQTMVENTTAKTTRKTSKSTTTKEPTSKSTVATYAVIAGAGTTAVSGEKIAVNVSYDSQVQKNFGYSQAEFDANARMLVNKELYSEIVGDTNGTLMLMASTSAIDITDQHISAAISGRSKYSTFNSEEALRLPVDLSLLYVDSSKNINTTMGMPASEVTVVLPIPKEMADTKKYTIVAALCDANGITKLLDTSVEASTLQFTTNTLSSVVILGFKSPLSLVANSGGIPTIVIVLITIGILMLGGAGTLLYFFFLRKPLPETGETDGEDFTADDAASSDEVLNERDVWSQEPGPNDIYSSSRPAGGVSLGSLGNKAEPKNPPKTKNPSDYDIDL